MSGSILSALGGNTDLSAIPTYLQDSTNETELASKYVASDATAKADITDLKSSASSLTSAKALLNNYKALNTVLTAFNMEGDIDETALLKQLMTQDPSSSTSTAHKSANATWIAFADAMDGYTTDPFTDSSTLNQVIQSYSINAYEQAQGSLVPGMTEALGFTRTASTITNLNDLMLNTNALKVAIQQTGLNYVQFADLAYDQQVSILTKDIKISDFQDSKKVSQMAEQYLLQASSDPTDWGASTSNAYTINSLFGSNSNPTVLDLFGGSSSSSSSILDLYG